MSRLDVQIEARAWPLREPFAISRGVQIHIDCIVVHLRDEQGWVGRGEGCGVPYAGETPHSMSGQIEAVRSGIEAGISRDQLTHLLPAGGARCAVDAALWDLEAKRSGVSAFDQAGLRAAPVVSAYTIGIRAVVAYEEAARARADYKLLKVKVGATDPIDAIRAARRGAPGAAFIVDPNQSWTVPQLKALAPALAPLGVALLEQPIPVGAEPELDGYVCPVRLCADELINEPADLRKAKGRFDVVNIKLDKTGGLTTALRLADEAVASGFELMVGCMAGSSLSMAPAMVLAQRCRFVDLDGPLLQSEDWPDGMRYAAGVAHPPSRAFWG